MSEQLLELNKRNQVMVWILWGCMLLGVGTAIDTPQMVKTIIAFGTPIALLCTILTWRKLAVQYVQYVITFGINVVSFFFLKEAMLISDLLILFLSQAIVSIYHNYRPLVLNGVLSIVILNYYLFTKEAYADVDVVGVNTFLILLFTALVAQSRIGSRMLKKVEASAVQSEVARKKTDESLQYSGYLAFDVWRHADN